MSSKTTDINADRLTDDLIQPGHPLFGTIWINPRRMSGAPCFFRTRVPVSHLFEYLQAGDPLEEFLDGFPGVSREQAVRVLQFACDRLLADLPKQ